MELVMWWLYLQYGEFNSVLAFLGLGILACNVLISTKL